MKIMSKARRAALVGAVGAASLAGSANAVTAVVPNQFQCSRWTGKCVQTNGTYRSQYPSVCYSTWQVYTSGRSTSVCSYWR